MSPLYEIFLRAEAVESLRGIKSANKKWVVSFIESLTENPFQEGDYSLLDTCSRQIQIKVVREYAVTFWADHPVKEIKIIDIRSADRA